jgi:hypothetical protein
MGWQQTQINHNMKTHQISNGGKTFPVHKGRNEDENRISTNFPADSRDSGALEKGKYLTDS